MSRPIRHRGTAATFRCAPRYCQQLLDDNGDNIVPIYVDLRRSSDLLRAPEPFDAIRAATNPALPDADGVTYLLLLDAFDEVIRDRHEISLGALLEKDYRGRRVRTVLTSRTHFFRTELDAANRLASATVSGTGLVDLHHRSKTILRNAVEPQKFTADDVKQYLAATFPKQWARYYQKLLRVYDLDDLARRPILLELIATILPTIDESEVITEASPVPQRRDRRTAGQQPSPELPRPRGHTGGRQVRPRASDVQGEGTQVGTGLQRHSSQ